MNDQPGDTDIHPILKARRSPYAFDPEKNVPTDALTALFQAARWTMSSSNVQPWRYIVGVRGNGDGIWDKVHSALLPGNQPWTRNAPVLCLGLVSREPGGDGKPNKSAEHDLGAASALLTVEAGARGMIVHQMIGIDPGKASELFELDDEIEPFTALAIGYLGQPKDVPEQYAKRDLRPRARKPLAEIIIAGLPEQSRDL